MGRKSYSVQVVGSRVFSRNPPNRVKVGKDDGNSLIGLTCPWTTLYVSVESVTLLKRSKVGCRLCLNPQSLSPPRQSWGRVERRQILDKVNTPLDVSSCKHTVVLSEDPSLQIGRKSLSGS